MISIPCNELEGVWFRTKIAEEGADILIFYIAIQNASTDENDVITGEDIDLLVLVTQLTSAEDNI